VRGGRAAAGQRVDALLNVLNIEVGEEGGLRVAAIPHLIGAVCVAHRLAQGEGSDHEDNSMVSWLGCSSVNAVWG
jgi:hypothetical protein